LVSAETGSPPAPATTETDHNPLLGLLESLESLDHLSRVKPLLVEVPVTDLRTIEVDFGVHKRVELERRSFAETPNAVLRRLLQIGDGQFAHSATPSGDRPWARKGVTLPHGTELRMEYNGRVHSGVIQNGAWIVEGGEYKSPSAAAGGVARTKNGKSTSLDGWIYWQAKCPGETQWVGISQLRRV
jgi:hypothetical protein